MKVFRTILVGLEADDGRPAPGSVLAAQQARVIARKTGAEVRLFHSTWSDRESGEGGDPSPDVRSELDALSGDLSRDGVSVSVELGRDRPWLDITRRVLAGEADLVIVGKRKKHVRRGRLLGANARKLVQSCPCPVWMVHPARGLVERLILAATDLTPTGELATRLGSDLAAMTGAELHVVHAYRIPMELQMERSGIGDEAYRERLAGIEAELRARIEGALEAPAAAYHLGHTTPERAILACVERHVPDLVVMGTVSRTGIPGLVMGDTAERMLDEIDTSLLTVKPPAFVCPVEP